MPGNRGRGRGRGGGRGGRGRGRGRGHSRGRGRGGSRGRGVGQGPQDDLDHAQANKVEEALDINADARAFFTGTASFDQHRDAQEQNKMRYVAAMAVLEKNGVEIAQNARIRALSAAWSRGDMDLAATLLGNRGQFGLVEVLKAVTLLDSSRRIRVHEKKLKRLQLAGSVKSKVLGKFKSDIDNLTAIKPKQGSASGAVCKHIRRWVKTFTQEQLEFFALHYPTEPWKKLADICHFNPTKDFPSLPWFLPFCFGAPAPEDTLVARCKDLNEENVNDLLKEYPIPYTHMKNVKDKLTEESKARISATDKLDTVLWYYEELQCPEADKVIQGRLSKGEEVTLPYGKLMERLLTIKMIREDIPSRSYYYGRGQERNPDPSKAPFFKDLVPTAEKQLEQIRLPLEAPIVVISDRSGSMEIAIRTSTIIASFLSAVVQAKLVFFNNQNMDAKFIPKNIEDVLEMAVTVEAQGGTTPAASLWPFYERKEVVKTFVVVTDEEENGRLQNMWFHELYKKYHDEVFPAKLVFVSFLRGQHAQGKMVRNLEQQGFHPMQFKFENSRPDLTKLENLFGLLSSESADFEEQLKKMEADMTAEGMKKVFENFTINTGDIQ